MHNNEWMGIESAPKDGTRILFYDPDSSGLIFAGIWDAKFEAVWDEEKEENGYRGAWTDFAVASFNYEEYQEYNPTLWQPLPPLPEHPKTLQFVQNVRNLIGEQTGLPSNL